jgi:hypothetical protein
MVAVELLLALASGNEPEANRQHQVPQDAAHSGGGLVVDSRRCFHDALDAASAQLRKRGKELFRGST